MAEPELTAADKASARAIFEGRTEGRAACQWCAGIHAQVAGLPPMWQPCPRIKRVERHTDGSVLVVEHWPPGTWEADVIFPADVYDEGPEPD